MALTKARFSKHLTLEPLTEIEFAKSKNKLEKLLKSDEYLYNKRASNQPQTSSSFLKKKFDPTLLEEHKYSHFRNEIKQNNFQKTLTEASSVVNSFNDVTEDNKSNKFPTSSLKSKLFDHRYSITERNSETSHVKKVSFSLPNPSESVQLYSHTNMTNDIFTGKPVTFPDIPMNKGRVTKQDHITPPSLNNSLFPVSNDTNKGCSNDKQRYKKQYHNRLNGHLSEDSSYKSKSLAQKVQNRRGKGYLIKHKLPKLSEPPKETLTVHQPSPNLILIKAREILLQKMKYPSTQTITPRRLIVLPTLAAPCSEEFAVAMRRTYGNKFISSPKILDHAIQKNVPYQATAMLLDAIVRPPSTPTYR